MTDKPTWVQPGSPLFDGADAWEEYGNEIERLTRERDEGLEQVAALRDALEPFVKATDAHSGIYYTLSTDHLEKATTVYTNTAAATEAVKRKWVREGMKRALDPWKHPLGYVLQDDLHNRLIPRIIDIAYSAFMQAKRPNDEDGGPSDWFTDTRPMVMEGIASIREAIHAAMEDEE